MMKVNDLPPGKVRSTVEKLSVEVQKRALLYLSRWGGNGDLARTLYTAGGALIASNNPEMDTQTALTQTVTGGTYYVKISPTGVGSPIRNPPSGYTSYGSIGPQSSYPDTVHSSEQANFYRIKVQLTP